MEYMKIMDELKVDETKEVFYKDLGDSLLIQALGNSPKTKIIDIFLSNPYFDFNKEELVRELGMSKQTLYKYLGELEELAIVKNSRQIGRAVMYRINLEHTVVKHLNSMINDLSLQISESEIAEMWLE